MADFAEVAITEDPEYEDLEPILQDDGPNPVVAIRYPKKFKNVHNYFRAIVHKNEISKRALKLTQKVIELNAANYTAWQYRRECIFKLKEDLFEELEFSKEIAQRSPKNYQLWWHRRIIIEAINKNKNIETDNDNINDDNNDDEVKEKYDLRIEKELLRNILKSDAKNYHAWSHYHWLLRTYKLYDDELHYLDTKLLQFDVRNNSAWNHRHFVVKSTTNFNDIKTIKKEIDFCQKKIERLATNHSVWYYYSQLIMTYLKNLANKNGDNDNDDILTWKQYRVLQIEWIQKVLESQPYAPRAILFYIDLLTDKDNANEKELNEAITLLRLLANKVDRIRYNYYNYLIAGIEKRIQK